MWKKSGLCQNNCLGIKWLSSLHCREVRSVITFSFDSRRNGPEDLKYLKFHQQTVDLVGTTGTVRIVKRNSERVKVKGIGCSVMSDSLWPHGLQHARFPCPLLSLGVSSNSCSLSRWCYPTILSSVSPFSSWIQSLPVSGSFPMSLASGGPSIAASASASVLPINIQGWFPFGLTGWISLQSKGLSRVFSSTTAREMDPGISRTVSGRVEFWQNTCRIHLEE